VRTVVAAVACRGRRAPRGGRVDSRPRARLRRSLARPRLLPHRHGGLCGDRWVDIKSTDINEYLKQHTGEEITAKDFRTWNATVLCAVGLAQTRANGRAASTK